MLLKVGSNLERIGEKAQVCLRKPRRGIPFGLPTFTVGVGLSGHAFLRAKGFLFVGDAKARPFSSRKPDEHDWFMHALEHDRLFGSIGWR